MWQINHTQAMWNDLFPVDVATPGRGLGIVPSQSGKREARLMCIAGQHKDRPWKLELVDSYQRGTDFIATYTPTAPDNVQPQIYWRGMTGLPKNCCGMELVLSMQTSLLDSDPTIEITSQLPPGQALFWSNNAWHELPSRTWCEQDGEQPNLLLLRPEDGDWSYAEAVFPSDFLQAKTEQSKSQVTWSHWMFAERLEKGVIRRGRIAGWLLPRDDDEALAVELCQAFCNSPPPLTT